MTEEQFHDALYDCRLLGGVSREDFEAAKKIEEILDNDNVLSKKEAGVVMTVTLNGFEEGVLKWEDNVTEEEAREIYDAAIKKLKAAAGVES